MAYDYKCPLCGANLDPSEKCDCEESVKNEQKIQKKEKENNLPDVAFSCFGNDGSVLRMRVARR